MGKKLRTRPGTATFEVYRPGTLRLEEVDLEAEAEDRRAAEAELLDLQEKLHERQVRAFLARRRAVFVFEGWDAAGKGGALKRMTALLDPRGYKVWVGSGPGEEGPAAHWLYRFATRLPLPGTLALFDRSWYGRVLEDRVEGRCGPREWDRAYDEINAFERTLTADGVAMAKFFFHLDAATQLARFKLREKDPVKQFKVSADDWRNRKRRPRYLRAYQEMFDRTHRPDAPWVLVAANDKRLARLQVLKAAIACLDG